MQDMDRLFVERRSTAVAVFVSEHGWPAFRAAEVALLAEALQQWPRRAIVACGGGIVETDAGRILLKQVRLPHCARTRARRTCLC